MAGKTVFRLVQMSVVLAIALALTTCGGGKKAVVQGLSPGSSQDNKTSPEGLDCRVDTAISLDQTLAELEGMECPEGVDEELWVELKDALKEALQTELTESKPGSPARLLASPEEQDGHSMLCPYKSVATPPTGEANRVNDLAISDNGDGTFTLSWHYRNLGDYDQDGSVGISDITPLAQHYNEEVPGDDTERNSLQAVIDGSGSGRIGIEDITPIAMHYAVEVEHYAVEGAAEEAGAYELVSEVAQDAGSGEGRLEYSVIIESPAALWHRVVPYDTEGTAGEPSNAVLRPSNEPIIYGVSPTEGYQHEEYTFTAVVTGTPPIEYAWDFGGGAEPDTSVEPSPTVTLADAGEYQASLTVTNAYGEASFPFTLTVSERDSWAHTWGGGEGDYCYDLLISGDESVYLSGSTSSFGAGKGDGLVVKFSMSGDLLWARTWGGEESEYTGDIAFDSGGNVIAAGGTNGFGEGKSDLLLTKYSPQGDLLQVMTWGTGDYERKNDMEVDTEGNIYLCGNWSVYGGDPLALIVKLDPEWNVLWAKRWGGTGEDRAYGILAHEGAVYVCGKTASFGAHDGDAFLMKMSEEGEVLWARTWGTELEDSFSEMTIGPDGCVYVVGNSKEYPVESTGLIVKYDSTGELIAARCWKGPLQSTFSDVCPISGGSVTVVGSRGWRPLLLKYDQNLSLVIGVEWGQSEHHRSGRCLAYDPEGYVFVAGEARNASGEWWGVEDFTADAPGTDNTVEGEIWDLEGVPHEPEGTKTTPEGIIDEGGGGEDILILKYYPQ